MNNTIETLATSTAHYAVDTYTDILPRYIIVTIGIRGVAVFEILIPKNRYDPFRLMEILLRHAQAPRTPDGPRAV